jgi:hypothetical protein
MINNIYLTKTGCFGYTDQQLALTPSSPLFNKLSITVFIVVDFPAPVGPQKSVNPVPLHTLKTSSEL